jgi:hypothetical protein
VRTASSDVPVPLTAQRQSGLKFKRVQAWTACPLGCLPGPIADVGRLPDVWKVRSCKVQTSAEVARMPAHAAEATTAATGVHAEAQNAAAAAKRHEAPQAECLLSARVGARVPVRSQLDGASVAARCGAVMTGDGDRCDGSGQRSSTEVGEHTNGAQIDVAQAALADVLQCADTLLLPPLFGRCGLPHAAHASDGAQRDGAADGDGQSAACLRIGASAQDPRHTVWEASALEAVAAM